MRRFPDDDSTPWNWGLLVDQDQHEKAREVLEPLTRRGTASHRGQAQYQLAGTIYRSDDAAEAEKHLDAAVKYDAGNDQHSPRPTAQGLVLRGPETARRRGARRINWR